MGFFDLFRGMKGARDPQSKYDGPAGAVQYYEYSIVAVDKKDGRHWLAAGVIYKEFDDGMREHHFVRGDRHGDKVIARNFSVTKAQQMIDAEGDRLFDGN